jgi:hypothetical protein
MRLQGAAILSLMENIYFRAWVSNAVHAVSGIWPLDWQGSQRKHALTCEEIRVAACQEGLEVFFHSQNQAFMRDASEVPTNKRLLH